MKRSRYIALTLLASLTLGVQGCSEEVATKREVYRTKQECLEDWGTEEQCEEDKDRRGHYRGPHYAYFGGYPYYYRRGESEAVPLDRKAGFSRVPEGGRSPYSLGSQSSSHIVRGGFGKSAAFHGASS